MMTQSDSTSVLNYSRVALMVGVPVALAGAGYYMWKASSPATTQPQQQKKSLTPAEQATELKVVGNEHFRRGEVQKAIEFYTQAISQGKNGVCKAVELATFYQNRAAAHEKLKDYQSVIEDCTEALKHDNKYRKALVRRSKAFVKIDNYEDAIVDATAANIVSRFNDEQSLLLLDELLRVSSHKKAAEAVKVLKATGTAINSSENISEKESSNSEEDKEATHLEDKSQEGGNVKDDEVTGEDKVTSSLEEAESVNDSTTEEIQAQWMRMLEKLDRGTHIDEVEQSLERDVASQPASVIPSLLLAMFLLNIRRDPMKAVESLKRAIEIDSKCRFTYELLGPLYIQLGNLDAGLAILDASLRLSKTEAEFAQAYSLIESAHAQQKAFKNLGLIQPDGTVSSAAFAELPISQ